MAIYLKDKKITPYRGDYKPVNIYQGAQKIAGWHDVARTGDSALEWDDTYNDYVGGMFGGRSELQAEYYASEGDSEQTGTPTPDAPIPITPYLAAGTYKITMPDGTYEVTLPADMHGAGGVRDRVVVDYVSKRAWLDGRCGVKVFDGMEVSWAYYTAAGINQFYIPVSNIAHAASEIHVRSTHYKARYINVREHNYNTVYTYTGSIAFNDNRFVTIPDWKSYLAAQYDAGTPVTVVYQLAEPTQTPLTLTPVDSSTAPELPLEFLADASSVSPDLPATIASAQPVVESRGRNLFDFNNTFGKGSGTIKLSNGYRVTLSNDWSTGWFDVIGLLPNTQYRLRGNIYQRGTLTSAAYSIRPLENPLTIIATPTTTLQSAILSSLFTTTASGNIRVYMYSNITATAMDSSCDFTDIIISLGTDVIPYTPYRAPTTLEFPELRAIAIPETATEWTYIRDGVKYWADTARYAGGGWWDIKRRVLCFRYSDMAVKYAHVNSNDMSTFVIFYDSNKIGTYQNPKVFGGMNYNFCTHFKFFNIAGASTTSEGYYPNWNSNHPYVSVRISNERIGALSSDTLETRYNKFVAWESAQNDAGHPLMFSVCLKEEFATTERVHLGTLKSYPRYTHVEQITDGVRAWMELDSRVIDRDEGGRPPLEADEISESGEQNQEDA